MESLCRACGLCCDGSLFGRVPLAEREVEVARRLRLPVVGGKALAQPCAAFHRDCEVYEDRPAACRAFACALVAREAQPMIERLSIVARTKELLSRLAREGRLSPDDLAELEQRVNGDFARADR
ncbi:MAG: YkgJ family cysteine cluster protein [Polyangiales bacterium]